MCVCVCVCVTIKKTKLDLLSELLRSAWCAFQRNPFMSAVKKRGKKKISIPFISTVCVLCLGSGFRFNVCARAIWL